MPVIFAGVGRVQKNHALEVRKQGFLVLAGEPAHIFHVHTGLFAYGQRQRLHRRIYLFGGLVTADGALGKQVGLALQIFLLVQYFQRTQQKVGAVLIERDGVTARIDESVFMGKGVIERV